MYGNFEWFTHNISLFNPRQVMSPFLPSHVSGSWELLVFYGGLLPPNFGEEKWGFGNALGSVKRYSLKESNSLMDKFSAPVVKLQSNNPLRRFMWHSPSQQCFSINSSLHCLQDTSQPKKTTKDSSRPWFFSSEAPKKIQPGEEADPDEIEENQAKSGDHLILIGEGPQPNFRRCGWDPWNH